MKKLLSRIFIIWLIPIVAFSQEKATFSIEFNNNPVADVLASLEEMFDVKFSYQDNIINGKKVTLSKKNRTLDEVLTELTMLINVNFQKLSERYIFLKPIVSISEEQHLAEVVIDGYLTRGITKNKNATYQISPQKLEILPGLTEPDIMESIQQLPGVISPNETATGLIVRGGASDQNRVIWDGINIYHNGHLFGMISAFNPNITENITFHNKGTNAKFGERISSVIDISTSSKIYKKLVTEFGFNGISADTYLATPILKDKLSLQVSFRRSFEDFLETSTFKNIEEKVFQNTTIDESATADEKFYFKDYNLKLNYKPTDKDLLSLSIIHIDNDLEHIFDDIIHNKSYKNTLDVENDGYSFGWKRKWNANITQNTQASLSKYRLNYHYMISENFLQVSDYDKRNVIYDSGLFSEFQLKTAKGNNWLLGYQYTLKDVGYEFKETTDITYILDADKTIINTHSLYANFSHRNVKWLDIDGGIRVNYYSELDAFRVEPRVIINKNISNTLKLQLTGEIKNQVISQIDETVLSDLSLEDKLWRLADGATFPIINSHQVSAGLLYSKNGWSIDVDHYYKKVTGITALSLGFLNPNDSGFHIGKQKIFGADFYLKKNFNKLKTWLSYSYIDVKSKYETLNNNQYFTASTEIKHAVSASVSYKLNQFQLALGWKWHVGKPFTKAYFDTNGTDLIFEGINTEKLPDYHRLDFSSTYRFNFSKDGAIRGKVGLSIRNLYDRQNHISREYIGNNAIDDPIEIIDKYSLGITPNFLFRIYW
ncbi:TonB-dependent receptor domain-containing protein [Lutibacter sp.]